ncbi:MAG: hypothetical protein EOP56_09980 [Sphingobacteriales bacterium]|nr:MAG: hypothetical protein EOP56_09980 [Sphingobacteriales bacterium]
MLIVLLVNLTPVQNYIASQAAGYLARKLDTRVEVKHVRIDFLNHVLLQGLYIEDRSKDTLLYAGEARVRISDWFILKKDKPVIRYVGLHNSYVHMYRKANSDQWNHQFIIDAFDTGKKDSTKKQNEFELDLEKVDISSVRFHWDDAWVGNDMEFDVGSLSIDAEEIDLKKRLIDINAINLKKSLVVFRDYEGGRPPRPKKKRVLDTTAFNKGNWVLKMDKLAIDDCYFSDVRTTDAPKEGEFDPEYIEIRDISGLATNIRILKDTLNGEIKNLTAKERSGIMIRKAHADVTVSPNASICRNLYIETNNSVLRDYYAMHYTRFPDFNQYIDKVRMEGNFEDAKIDSRDVAYFAPQLRQLLPPTIIYASGKVSGTVDSVTSKRISVTDGYTTIKGDLNMTGLPDIYTTWIDYRNGEIYTNGNAVMRYAPDLRRNPNLALEKISHAYFKGNFIGYVENFAANGILTTNLGTITSDVDLDMRGIAARNAVYKGTVTTQNFNAGALFRQPDLGYVSLRAGVSGRAFDPKVAQVRINSIIDRIDYRGYSYRNIMAEGLLAKNLFSGNALIDDPNLALTFSGDLDLSKQQLGINARAHLLYSNLMALKLVNDSITASADFDLDWTGNHIDNFLGYAKLYNVNVNRNGHHLDIDSVYVRSAENNGKKQLSIQSNALTANINGDYQLSSLPYSFQYYISRYLPNYIAPPKEFAAKQDISFDITTNQIDSLLGVIVPDIKGFSNTEIKGILNTTQQKLTLNVNVPYGYISGITIRNTTVNGDGNNNTLGLNLSAENVTVGDSVLTGSVSVTTTVGNDSLAFNIATNSISDDYGTATLNGTAYASSDSLYFNILPSEFFLKQKKWEIPGGSDITLSGNYLYIRNLVMRSGLQEIAANSREELGKNVLGVGIRNLDVALIGSLAGISAYEPEGRINGDIILEDIFTHIIVSGDVRANDVRLGADTIGNINIAGSYDARKQLINLDPKSGIYRGNSSITAAGNVLFDSTKTNNQKLDGVVRFQNAPIGLAGPFLEGFMSNIGGTLNGTVNIGGTASAPDVNGQVRLDNGTMKLDILGTTYTIPTANISVNNDSIDVGTVSVYDALKNNALLIGKVYHNRFKDFRFNISAGSSKFEVMNLREHESDLFYGNLIAGFRSLNITGPLEDLSIRIVDARPRAASHLYLPITTTTEMSSYSYVTFKTYGKEQEVVKKKENRISINIDARLNELAEISLVLDPSTGDAINAKGTGNIALDIPANSDMRMNGSYNIIEGNYVFTISQLFFKRVFALTGGRIDFNGSIEETRLDVDGVYTTRARLFDVLTESEKSLVDENEAKEAKQAQDVNVLLNMKGSLEEPKLTFRLDVPNKRAVGTSAYNRLMVYNQNEQQLYTQVGSLLLINSFIPPETGSNSGLTNSARTGAISNVSSIFSSTASSQLTNIVSKITGDKDLSVDFKYNPYTAEAGTVSRNELSLGFKKSLYNNRLNVEVGSSLDWGRATGTSSNNRNNFNPVGDFRAQYQIKEGSNLRLNVFRMQSYDVVNNSNMWRGGVGLSWKKSFNTLSGLFGKADYAAQLEELRQQPATPATDTSKEKRVGTW